MATSNKRVFDKFLALMKSRKICSQLSDQDMTILLNTFLNESASVYFKQCKKDLSKYQKYDFYTQNFTADGISNQYTLSKFPISPASDAIFYSVKINGIEQSYTFDDNTFTFTVTPTPTIGQTVICAYDFVGQFDEDLNDEEEWILAHGMLITWISGNILTDNILSDMVVTINFSTPHSPANLLDKLLDLKKQSLKEIRQLSVSYTFNGFTGFN